MSSVAQGWAPVRWGGDAIEIVDQTLLPGSFEVLRLDSVDAVIEAIHSLRVRGAPVLGTCGAYGMVVGLDEAAPATVDEARDVLVGLEQRISASRPTAVNLPAAVARVREATAHAETVALVRERALDAARAIAREDETSCERMAEHGRELLERAGARTLLTHCNTGRLASSGWGTALGVVYALHAAGNPTKVFACETRPLLQGARLTTWELMHAGIDVTLIVDSAAGALLHSHEVDAVLVGADRIALNGDTANKVGTYPLALAAHATRVPFYVVAPTSSFDSTTSTGRTIAIEQRAAAEVTHVHGRPIAVAGVKAWNPAFDVTPNHLVTAYITELGVVHPPFDPILAQGA